MNYVHDNELKTPRELIDSILDHPWFRTRRWFEANRTGTGGMIFRGHSDDDWKLCPSAFRDGKLDDFTPQPPARKGSARQRLGSQLHAEARSIWLFLQAADSLGIPSPIDYTTTKDGLAMIEAALNDRDWDYENEEFPGKSSQRATALAQHHGVPTRYLDWSESPLVAAYFAAIGASSLSGTTIRDGQKIAIYFLSVDQLNRNDSPIEMIRAPRHENSHLLQQSGVFTSFKRANSYFLEHERWPCMVDYITPTFQVHRFTLPAECADALLRTLFDLRVTRHSLMPTLGNAADAYRYVKALWPRN